MLAVISPAKRLDWDGSSKGETVPVFLREAGILASHARQLSLKDLKALMGLSDDLARLNRDRFRAYENSPSPDATRAAVEAFAGDTYQGLEARSMDDDARRWATDHLRILSGLYGLLRPYDAIQPYRLEMGSRLKTRRGKSLYDFWGGEIARVLRRDAESAGTDTILNCASVEYFGAVDEKALGLRVVTPVFLEERGGTAKTISFFAKRARGSMARFAMDRRITDPRGLEDFDLGGYRFDPERSAPDKPVFVRAEAVEAGQAA